MRVFLYFIKFRTYKILVELSFAYSNIDNKILEFVVNNYNNCLYGLAV